MPEKAQGKIRLNWQDSRNRQSQLKVMALLAIISLCWELKETAVLYLSICFKSTWCWAEMLCSCAGRDACFERDTAISCPQLGSDLTTEPCLHRLNLGRVALHLLYHHAEISPQGWICIMLGTIAAVCKGAWKSARAWAAPWNPHPFPGAMPTCLPLDP